MRRLGAVLAATAMAVTAALAVAPPGGRDPQVGQSFKVPYRLTDTNHFLVRVRINGKGPFNFLVDSGAPALFVSTEAAKKIGLKPADASAFWTPIDRLDIEGGARLTDVKARVEDPFQLVGMNALGLPGATIDGILGFTILGRYRLEIDLTQDRMTWTRLDHDPRDPPVPRTRQGEKAEAPAGVQAMNALGPLAKGMAFLMGKQPEEKIHLRGFLGVEWSAAGEIVIPRAEGPPRAGRLAGRQCRPPGGRRHPADQWQGRRWSQEGGPPPLPASGRAIPSPCSSAEVPGPMPAS